MLLGAIVKSVMLTAALFIGAPAGALAAHGARSGKVAGPQLSVGKQSYVGPPLRRRAAAAKRCYQPYQLARHAAFSRAAGVGDQAVQRQRLHHAGSAGGPAGSAAALRTERGVAFSLCGKCVWAAKTTGAGGQQP